MKRASLISILLLLCISNAGAQSYDRGYGDSQSRAFIEKGTWMVGGGAGFTRHQNKDHKFFSLGGINSEGFHISAKPDFLYMMRDNLGIGARFSYSRGLLDVDDASLSVKGINLGLKDYCCVNRKFSGDLLCRLYIPIGNVNRIAMFAEGQAGMAIGASKVSEASTGEIVGTYEDNHEIHIGVNPGITAFLSDNLALELSLGIANLSYTWCDQLRNKVDDGNRTGIGAGFILNPLELNISFSYFICKKKE